VVTFTATDVSDDLAQIDLYDETTGKRVTTTAAPWTFTWDTGSRTGGAWVEIVLTDKLGNYTFLHDFYAIDNTGPTIHELKFPEQEDKAIVDGRVSGRSQLTVSVFGPSPLDRVEWWVDGTLRSTFTEPADGGGREPYFDWDTGTANGIAELEIRAYDQLGHHATLKRAVVIDNTGPTITSITPGNRTLVRGDNDFNTFKTTVTAADPAGIRYAELQNGLLLSDAPYAANLTAGKDGPQTVVWTVTDRLGNKSTAQRVVIVDNTKPKVAIGKAPRNGAKVKGTVKVTASASDRNGVNRVELLINGKVVAKDTKAAYAFAVNTKKYGKKIKIQLRCYDNAGNSTKTSTLTWRR
jgi:hypothetical protein